MSSGTVLVVGGAGYVGAHTCKALSRHGFTPVVFDNLSTGHENFVRWETLIRGDIRDADAVLWAIKTHNVNAVLHFAASAYAGESVTDPQKYYGNNVAGTLTLLSAMLQAGISALLLGHSWRYRLVELRNLLTNETDVLAVPLPERFRFLYPIMRLPLWVWRHASQRKAK